MMVKTFLDERRQLKYRNSSLLSACIGENKTGRARYHCTGCMKDVKKNESKRQERGESGERDVEWW
jgi:hypothetical protein